MELAPSSPDEWDYWTSSVTEELELICLLPNSVYISMKASWDATLQNVKEELWDRATKYPLFGMLHEMSGYVFQFVNSLAVLEEVADETKSIRDLKPTFGTLVIVERSVKKPGEQCLNTQIGNLIGKGLNEFTNLRSSEVQDFRFQMQCRAEESMAYRAQCKGLQRLRYQCPLRLADKSEIPVTLKEHLTDNCFSLITKIPGTEYEFESKVPAQRLPKEHLKRVLMKLPRWLNMRVDQLDKYVLKVPGREEYLFDDKPLIQYLYIQETLYAYESPHVTIVSLDNLPYSLNREIKYVSMPARKATGSGLNTIRKKCHDLSWNINMNYTCLVRCVGRLNVDCVPGKEIEVICQVGIFHGGRAICESQKTRVAVVGNQGIADWEQELTFPIKVYNIPRMARLCFGIYSYELVKTKGKWLKDVNKEVINKLAWVNVQIFDYKMQLRTNSMTLLMWPHVANEGQDVDHLLHPLGTIITNPNTDSCAQLQVFFSNYYCKVPIVFPGHEHVQAYSENIEMVSPYVMERVARDFDRIRLTAETDSLYDMHELEKKDIWAARDRFRKEAPELLPKLLSCVEWGDRAEVSTVSRMLLSWPVFDRVEPALELLDYAYADAAVRSFAVKCLNNMSDGDVLLYLLQLVQTLKHESYLMCELAIFLLERAFKNMTIGHYLFWHLRSEMHVPSVSVRFGLMLEAYCRGAQDHLSSLMHQINCLEKLKWVTQCLRKKTEISKAREMLPVHLQERHCKQTLCDFVSPLDPSFICKKVKLDGCRVMDSKMRPLKLTFENVDPSGGDICIILKMGDDLRQDMFTLQILRIMDNLWKTEGGDFRLNPYKCISMEYAVGMIQVVENAETIANIQKQDAPFNAASTLRKKVLLQWIEKHNTGEAFNRAAHEFTMSCAGYCVATYVLGIADRHPDNIMVKKSGQLFHIDFGHFLGHFKQKFGIKRERAPFVLTHDIIYLINRGQTGSDNELTEFIEFKKNLEKAFMILRKHGRLILSLFSMMISTGLPELSSEQDLQYLRETLVMDLSPEDAKEHFQKRVREAIRCCTSTAVHWSIHNVIKKN